MDEDTIEIPVDDPTSADASNREKIEAIARLIYAFISPLLALIPLRYKADIQEALDKMKEVIDGNANS